MTDGLQTIIYPVHDLAAATALYTALLGTAPTTDQPYYVGSTSTASRWGWTRTVTARG